MVFEIISASVTLLTLSSFVFSLPYKNSVSLPLYSSERWILDSQGEPITYVGINWPGSADVMIPEGLQYQSIEYIVDKIVDMGLNVVRLTFAIEMIDDIYETGNDVTLQDAFIKALGPESGITTLNAVIQNNPQFSANTTRLQVYDAIAKEIAMKDIFLHLDNHISKGQWCCSIDGNGWFNDTYFNVNNWIRGLSYMADHGKNNWPTFSSIGLRNEPRYPANPRIAYPYTWSTWAANMTSAAKAVHTANQDILIFFSGKHYGVSLTSVIFGGVIDPTTGVTFDVTEYDYYHKMVFELHTYSTVFRCSWFWSYLYRRGFGALNVSDTSVFNRLPVVLTEWGHKQGDSSSKYRGLYHTCLHSFAAEWKFGWMLWTISGSYYIRSGTQDMEDTWGILDKEWADYRGNKSSTAFKQMAADTFASDADSGVHFSQTQINAFNQYMAPRVSN
ncbi:glycoside hydrolase superfamily [Lipomyces starkeyi]